MKFYSLVLALVSFASFAQVSPAPREKICAVAFNSLDRNYSSKLNLTARASISDLNNVRVATGGDWDNRISKVVVYPGCTFVGYQYQDFNVNYTNGRELNGFTVAVSNEYRQQPKTVVLGYENEKISSVKCFCQN